MYNLLIVDDEAEIQEGLSRIDWHSLGIELTGVCSQGLEALQFLTEHPVDIVLTDIRMPFMDGIKLMEMAQVRHPFVRFIILSGYSDFAYAQKALELGADDYLLKPTVLLDLRKAFEKLIQKLDVEKQSERKQATLLRKEMLLARMLREQFLGRLLRMKVDKEEIEQGCSDGEMILDAEGYVVSLIRLDRMFSPGVLLSERERRLIVFSLDNILADIWDGAGRGYHWIDPGNADCYLLSKGKAAKPEMLQVKGKISKFRGLFLSSLSLSIGPLAPKLTDIYRSADAALRAMNDSSDGDVILECGGELLRESLQADGDFEETNVEKGNKKQNSFVLQEAKAYIRNQFHRSLTLKQVAAHVHMTPGHLSFLFRETGESYQQFLTTIRLKRSMELLADIRYKIYEIVEMVGYSDQAYFSEIFKRYTGQTPTEYRANLK